MRAFSSRRPIGTRLCTLLILTPWLLLCACGQAGVAPTGPVRAAAAQTAAARTGTIVGDVVAGPTCPVAQAENPCPPQPVAYRMVSIETPAGATVATTTTDVDGHFSVSIAPGMYVVQVKIVAGQIGILQSTPGAVTVTAGQSLYIKIELDTGIR